MEGYIKKFDQAYVKGDVDKEYLAFSQFMQKAFISEDGYIIDTGNYQTVNAELLRRANDKIKKHPIIWKIFFMIA